MGELHRMAGNESIASVYMSIRSRLARAIAGIVPPKDIEDIVQETYVRVCQAGGKVNIRTPQSFLFKTVRNLAIDYAKSSETRLSFYTDSEQDLERASARHCNDETFNQVAADEEFAKFCDAVRHLPVQCRRVFVLKKVYGLTQREIAEELNIKESTVEKHISAGIRRCSDFMSQCNSKNGDASRSMSSESSLAECVKSTLG